MVTRLEKVRRKETFEAANGDNEYKVKMLVTSETILLRQGKQYILLPLEMASRIGAAMVVSKSEEGFRL